MNTVELSIVMPFFNKGEMVAEMFDSILANDYGTWELLAVDDGSSAETIARLQPYSERDPRIRVIHREILPKGAPTCRNIGLEQARGEFIIFFDSDDYITPSCLGTRVRMLRKHPELEFMVFPSAQFIDGQMSETGERAYGYPIYSDDIAAFSRRTLPFVVVNNIYRTETLRRQGILWDTRLSSLQDADFNMQCLLSGMKYDYALTPPDYGYRIEANDGSISKRLSSDEHLRSHPYALDKFYRLVREKFGHRYDRDLFWGVLFVYNMVFLGKVNYEIAGEMGTLVCRYDRFRGNLLLSAVRCTRILSSCLPYRIARALPMTPFLVWRRWHEWHIVQECRELITRANFHTENC